jgi:HEPN domain-containing protein
MGSAGAVVRDRSARLAAPIRRRHLQLKGLPALAFEKEKVVQYWIETADRDFQTVNHLFQSGDYHWGLFLGHLVLEKLFKALYVKKFGEAPPQIHDLSRLVEKCALELPDETLNKLDLITRFNLSVRYPDYRQEIYRMCTREFSLQVLESIKEIRSWLLPLIRQS